MVQLTNLPSNSGTEIITENGKTGIVRSGRNNTRYGDIGQGAIDLSNNSTTSSTHGATGDFSTAMGLKTTASGKFSTAIGTRTVASGDYSTAMGIDTKARSLGEVVLGIHNRTTPQTAQPLGIQAIDFLVWEMEHHLHQDRTL